MKQVQALGDSVAEVAKAAYDYAEKLAPMRADLALEARKAQAAERAAAMVEKAAARRSKRKVKKAPAATSQRGTGSS